MNFYSINPVHQIAFAYVAKFIKIDGSIVEIRTYFYKLNNISVTFQPCIRYMLNCYTFKRMKDCNPFY